MSKSKKTQTDIESEVDTPIHADGRSVPASVRNSKRDVAIALIQSEPYKEGKFKLSDIAKALDVSIMSLYHWRKRFEETGTTTERKRGRQNIIRVVS